MLDSSEPLSEYDEAEMNLNHDINVSNTRYQNSDPLFYSRRPRPERSRTPRAAPRTNSTSDSSR
jgi:hypothetical protein